MEERLRDAEQQKTSLKKQIENFMNEEHTQNGVPTHLAPLA